MKPFCRVLANGEDITRTLMDYVVSLEITDEAEDKSDRITIELDDRVRARDNGFLDIPLIGTMLTVILGYESGKVRIMGTYLVDEIAVSNSPQILSVTGRAAFMNTAYRTPISQSYHQTTLGSIFKEIATRNGYSLKTDPTLAKIVVRHIDQVSESDMAFAARLAGEYDAVAKPMEGRLVLAKCGEGKAITGEALPIVIVHEELCTSWHFRYSARDEVGVANGLEMDAGDDQKAATDARALEIIDEGEGLIHMDKNDISAPSDLERIETAPDPRKEEETKGGVIATYHDLRSGEKREVTVGNPPFHVLKYTYHNQSEAVAAISAYRNKSLRGKASFICDMDGDPFIQAEAKLVQMPPFRPYIPDEWRIKSVKHSFSPKGGYTTRIECELFDEVQEDAAQNITQTTPDKDDRIDPNAPPSASYDDGEGVIHMAEEDT
ncbi:phage late control D family protein [Bartonella sp. A05]|uniref:phage late control D family protein n=1 Tax=Bartonella sp. A05 TaxID=2967261 RepID=UPI0022A98453|nr:contractile injection system protein, VgrG/Pvc8 family [Bartonella sp. A05]MCZ2203987.1 contractile injection system protein, VgrG/Pvc8 family [Bartonella sp. A05]